MLSNEVAKAILKQVDEEFKSERHYIAMEYYFKSLDLNGYAKLFHEYALEERKHAYMMLEFLDEWNHSTAIGSLESVNTSFDSPKHVFELAYAHEKFITKSINDILTLARNKKDNVAIQFLDWFVEEQREEEDKMITRLNRLKLAGDNMAAILFLDHEDGLQ